jgi:ATP-binding cassette subfamily B protein
MANPRRLLERLPSRKGLKQALEFVYQGAPGWTVLSTILVLVMGLIPLATLFLLKRMIDSISRAIMHPHDHASRQMVLVYVGLSAGLAILAVVLKLLSSLVTEIQARAVADSMLDRLHAKSIEIDLEYYESSQYYDTLHRAQQEAPSRPLRIVNNLTQIGQSAISLIAVGGLLLFTLHWTIIILFILAAIPGLILRISNSTRMFKWQVKSTATERRVEYFNWLITSDTHAKEVRLFKLGNLFSARSKQLRKQLRTERAAITTNRLIGDSVSQASAALVMYGAFTTLALQAVAGVITIGSLLMFLQAFQRGQSALQDLLGGSVDLFENSLFLDNLFQFLSLSPKVAEPSHPLQLPRPIRRDIVFDHVSFGYAGSGRTALQDISMRIEPGETIALVGENGSGKTTLVKLLCRLYDPTSGSIKIDGINLRDMSSDDLRRDISVTFQDYSHFYMSGRENIWFGNIDLDPESDQIYEAARMSGADVVIDGLPAGYETTLGYGFDSGEELSIGQWQKLALARAFLRKAQIIIFDEPSSALDAKAEEEVFDSFRRLVGSRTAIIISHRLSTIKMADRIFYIENGRITESGTHHELVEASGSYAHMFELQAKSYI